LYLELGAMKISIIPWSNTVEAAYSMHFHQILDKYIIYIILLYYHMNKQNTPVSRIIESHSLSVRVESHPGLPTIPVTMVVTTIVVVMVTSMAASTPSTVVTRVEVLSFHCRCWEPANEGWRWRLLILSRPKIQLKYAPAALLDADFGPLGRNQHPARRGTIVFDRHPDLWLRVNWRLNEYFAARYANPQAG